MSTDTTNPVGGEETAEATLDAQTEVETEGQTEAEPEFDEDGNPIAEPDEDEEFDLDDDLKITVPKTVALKLKELKDGTLRQADYTKKTQALADERKTFETERNTAYQSTQEELNAFAQAQNLAADLAAYQNVDWDAWENQDPFEAQKGWRTYQQKQQAHQGAINKLSSLAQQRQAAAQQETAKRIGEGRQQLEREIGWNDQLKAKLTDHALGMGLSREDLADLEATPAAAKILRDAYEWAQHQQKTKAAKSHVAAQQVQPAAVVSARSAPPVGLDDRQGVDAWMKARDKQVRKRA